MRNVYKKQVVLLIDILTEIAKDESFVLHGGTAINLFHLNMPRLSVDIDLTFVPFSSDRNEDLGRINRALQELKSRLIYIFPNIRFEDERRADEELKLLCTREYSTVKVEVNQINRGLIAKPCVKTLCKKAEEEFDRFCEISTVSEGQLWGGKLNAALERQHPRDIFDVKSMLQKIGFTNEIKQGFLFFLLCSKRPFDELLNPNYIDQRVVFKSQFSEMTDEEFTYEEFENIRGELIEIIQKSLTLKDKEFLLSFTDGVPLWNEFDYSIFPSVRWKLLNIKKLKEQNIVKHREGLRKLEQLFSSL